MSKPRILWGTKTLKTDSKEQDRINSDFMLNHVQQILRHTLGSIPEGKSSTKMVLKKLRQSLGKLQGQNVIQNYSRDPTVHILWETWSWRQKVKWYVAKKLGFAKNVRDFIANINDFYITESDCKYPKWAIEYPRSIAVANLMIQPIESLEHICLNIKVEE